MRNLAVLLLLSALNTGCATSVGPDRSDFGQSGAGSSTNQQIVESQGEVRRDTKPDTRESDEPAKTPAENNPIWRTLNCGAVGAVAGAVGGFLGPALLSRFMGELPLYLIPIIVPVGAIVGLTLGAERAIATQEICSWKW